MLGLTPRQRTSDTNNCWERKNQPLPDEPPYWLFNIKWSALEPHIHTNNRTDSAGCVPVSVQTPTHMHIIIKGKEAINLRLVGKMKGFRGRVIGRGYSITSH